MMPICFITGPEGSGTSVLVRALTNHPNAAKGDAVRHGGHVLRGAAGAQLIPISQMSTRRPGNRDLADAQAARMRLQVGASSLVDAQPAACAIFFKYSTPAFRPALWPVFLPLFDVPEFRLIVIWRRPVDAIYSAYRRFYRGQRWAALGLLAACRVHGQSVLHIRRQLARSPRERCLSIRYESIVCRPEPTLRALCDFADLEYRPAEALLSGRGFSDENGKWKQALRRTVVGDRAAPG
jgi:hypothetical protein